MNTFLLTWNPNVWSWNELEEELDTLRKQGFLNSTWSCGVTKQINTGDRVFLLRQGEEPRGIVAVGHATSERYEDKHFIYKDRKAWYINVRFDVVLNPYKEPILTTSQLIEEGLNDVHWKTQSSGIRITPKSASRLESLWADFIAGQGHSPIATPDEIITPERFYEGAVRQVNVNAYERDTRAREECIKHYGLNCSVCDFNFEEVYGSRGKSFIHVHHLVPLASIGKEYAIDPIKDMRPVCPNCHAMIHRVEPTLSIEELRKMTEVRTKPSTRRGINVV